ncbi:hypothetical protein SAMN05660733_08036 [Lentzea albidocapillata]|uniref:Uncharacterized protein n=1 Tax=Lentzea albidocapillata TaxID=40571 RepID=A0A1W2FTE6_9PSEU|nr:hypothetical protein SAMN05660733_08036 [Lentzea albidocapillata]
MIVSLLHKVTWKLLSAASALLRSEAEKDTQLLVLRHKNGSAARVGDILTCPIGRVGLPRFDGQGLMRCDHAT